MTIDQIIALSASIGACLSAIATFLTVRQMIKQREESYRPELVLSRTFFEGLKDPISQDPIPTHWVSKPDANGGGQTSPIFSLPLRNVGLGAAKAISVQWSFPIEETVNQANHLAQRTLTPAYFTLKNGILSIKSDSIGTSASLWVNQQHDSLDYVLPAAVQKEPAHLKLPHAFIQLSSALLFLFGKEKDRKLFPEIPVLKARLEYLDISNKTHTTVFDIKLEVIVFGGGGTFIDGYLESKKCA